MKNAFGTSYIKDVHNLSNGQKRQQKIGNRPIAHDYFFGHHQTIFD